jgi:hypothetical protein
MSYFAGLQAGLVSLGGEVVAEVAEGVLDSPKRLVVGQIDEFVGQPFEDTVASRVPRISP